MTFGIYLGALLITIIGCHLYKNCIYNNKYVTISIGNIVHWTFRKKTFTTSVIVILPPLLLVALRYGIGGDYFNYKSFYEQFLYYGYSQFEPLTEGLMSLNNVIFHDYRWFVATVAVITYILSLMWVLKNSDIEYTALAVTIFLCFYFAHSMNTIIQVLAASILMWSIVFIQKRKLIPFIIVVGIAALIHSSALAFLPVYFIGGEKNDSEDIYSRGNILKVIAIVLACATLALIYFTVAQKYGWLFSGYIGKTSEGGYINVYLKLGILFYIPELFFMPKLLKTDKKYEMYYIFLMVEIIAFVMTLFVAYAFRLAYYFSFAHCIIIPGILKHCLNSKSRMALMLYFCLALLFHFYFTAFICGFNSINIYNSILFN